MKKLKKGQFQGGSRNNPQEPDVNAPVSSPERYRYAAAEEVKAHYEEFHSMGAKDKEEFVFGVVKAAFQEHLKLDITQ